MNKYYSQYLNTLNNEVIPFWLKYSKDESGAIVNCLKEDGTVLSRDRFIWSQGRALWTYSALYNKIEKKQEYLESANGLFNYLLSVRPEKNNRGTTYTTKTATLRLAQVVSTLIVSF